MDAPVKTAQELIGTALDDTGWTWREVVSGIAAGHFHLFQNDTAACIGEFMLSPRHKVLHIWLAGGEMGGLFALEPEVIDYAKRYGCDIVGGTGRSGWVRVMKKLGYKDSEPSFEKEI